MRSHELQSDRHAQDRLLACPPAATKGMITCIVVPQAVMVAVLTLAWSQGVFRRPEGLFWFAPFLPPLGVLMTKAILAWRIRRLRRRLVRVHGCLCVRCAYIVDGLGPSGQCPECGLSFDRSRTVKAWVASRHYRLEGDPDREGP